jgi:two-component system, NarL family, sensor histidine kinase ComP
MSISKIIKKYGRTITRSIKIAYLAAGLLIDGWALVWILPPICEVNLQRCPDLPWDLVPIIVSLAFLWVGFTILFDTTPVSDAAFFSISSTIFMTGLLSGLYSDTAMVLFYFLLAWLAPSLLQFIGSWSSIQNKGKNFFLCFLYILSGIWSVLLLISVLTGLEKARMVSLIYLGVRIEFIFAALFVIVYFLIVMNKKEENEKQHIRLLFFGVVLAFLPIILFSLIPSMLGFHFVPTEASFIFLLFIPLTYLSSTNSNKFHWLRKRINQGIYYYLLIVLTGSGFLMIAELIGRLISSWKDFWAWICSAVCIFFIFIINRIDRVVEKLVYWIVNGNEKDYLELVINMSDALGLVHNREVLIKILVDDLFEKLQLSGCALFLKNGDGISLFKSKGYGLETNKLSIQENCELIQYLKNYRTIIDNEALHKNVKSIPAILEVHFQPKTVTYWIPLISGEELYGLLVIGHFPHDYYLTKGEWQALKLLAHQAGVASHNVHLLEELQKTTNELAYAHQKLLIAHELESKQISNKLHDNFIQELLGVSYQLAEIKENVNDCKLPQKENILSELDSARGRILQTTTELRNVVGELIPAGLEEFGLCKALEGYIYKIRKNPKAKFVQFRVNLPEIQITLNDELSICLFRVAQEAIRNSIQHAHARKLEISISTNQNEVFLCVADDGCGFLVPKWKTEITETNHFGLLGMKERISWVGGQITIQSKLGKGTKIVASVPLKRHVVIEKETHD